MASRCDKPFLPFEIIINILKRLPVKSIVRFRCVCKEWKNLFTTPSFMAEHLDHSDRKNPFLLLHEWGCESWGFIDRSEVWRYSLRLLDHKMETIEVLSIPSIAPFGGRWKIIGSCNGLLCIQVYNSQRGSPRSFWLWNPVIREVREVPNAPNDRRDCTVGFGFSSVVNDYKIVRFYMQELPKNEVGRLYHHNRIDGVEVYSLSTGSWKELEFGPLHLSAAFKAINVDGTIFWLDGPVVLSFDIATEVATVTQLPSEDGIHPLGLGVYENKLVGHYGIIEEDGRHCVDVRVMEEVASESGKSLSCTQKYRIDQGSHFSHNLCFWRKEMVCVDRNYATKGEGEPNYVLHMFNLYNNEERKFYCSTSYDWCHAFNYEKSLVSVWKAQQVE